MGLFDSWCAVSGLSLSPLEVAWVPLEPTRDVPAGPPVFGVSDRLGSIDGPLPPAVRFTLVARKIFEAVATQSQGLAAFGPFGPTHDGGQHVEGDVFVRHVQACRRYASLPWMLDAIEAAAIEAERTIAAWRGRDAPAAGWLQHATDGYYGVVCGEERAASVSFDGMVDDLESYAYGLFDENLMRADHPMVHRVERGEREMIDVSSALAVVDGARRALLSDLDASQALFAEGEDPAFEVDREQLGRLARPLRGPLAAPQQTVWFGAAWGEEVPWARRDERHRELFPFAVISTLRPPERR